LDHFYPEDGDSSSSEILTPVYQTTGTGCYIPEVCNLGLGLVYVIMLNRPTQFVFTWFWV
jgi:hypothetical protein